MNILQKVRLVPLTGTLLLSLALAAQGTKESRDNDKTEKVKTLIESKSFTFVAQSVTPMRGGTRQLTTTYNLKVLPDKVDADLPYFGRAYTAPINSSDAGIRFTSTDFEWTVKESKKKGWDITIKPKGAKDVRLAILSVSRNGYASLQVTSQNRQPISYQGYIDENKAK